jgi:hypothetical protein
VSQGEAPMRDHFTSARMEQISARIVALRNRESQLASGTRPIQADVAAARVAAEQSAVHADAQRGLTVEAYRHSAQLHRHVATVLGTRGGHDTLAGWHRAAAELDEAACAPDMLWGAANRSARAVRDQPRQPQPSL